MTAGSVDITRYTTHGHAFTAATDTAAASIPDMTFVGPQALGEARGLADPCHVPVGPHQDRLPLEQDEPTLAERLVEGRAKHLLLERAADQAVAVLARQRPAVGQHQLGHLGG